MFGSFSFSVHNHTYQTSINDSENINDYKSLEVTSTLKEKRTSPKHLCFTDEATELSTAKGSSSSWMVRSTLSIPFFLFYPKGKHTRCQLVNEGGEMSRKAPTKNGEICCIFNVLYVQNKANPTCKSG